ncbi:uncharacterized protein [Rutidosis leptorrhynchoides]|uniref:uncharacterized protein n=1 Tax=Rutidosis leptorrhynchoides TaxID=125765 RepID=UPI003A99B461
MDSLLVEVSSFCTRHDISILDMDSNCLPNSRKRRRAPNVTNLHHYRVELFYTVIDMQLLELNDYFNETNTELLCCLACLNPENLFLVFKNDKLLQFTKLYFMEFSQTDLVVLDNQLETYIIDMRCSDEFQGLKGLSNLARKLVETKRDIVYPLVYQLVKLELILPVATVMVEKAFSAVKIVNNGLRNRMGDAWMNDCLIIYIENDVLNNMDRELILRRFQKMRPYRDQLVAEFKCAIAAAVLLAGNCVANALA